MAEKSATIKRLDDQISWYDKKSAKNKAWYIGLKVAEIIIAALIPFLSGLDIPNFFIGITGVVIVVLEGVQHLFQLQNNWTSYRSTCEDLKHEKYLWEAKGGPYENITDEKLLADRIESLISQEHAKWISGQKSDKSKK